MSTSRVWGGGDGGHGIGSLIGGAKRFCSWKRRCRAGIIMGQTVTKPVSSTGDVPGLDAALAGKAATSHAHSGADITTGTVAAARLPTGTGAGQIPILDGGGKLSTSILPGLAIVSISVVASQAAMLALTAEQGDIAIRSDISKTFALAASPASTLSNWVELQSPTDAVTSVAGRTGAVTLTAADIGSGVFPVARLGTGTPDGTKFLRDDGVFATPAGGGGGTPGGATSQVQYNNGGAFAGSDKLTFSASGTTLTVGNASTAGVVSGYSPSLGVEGSGQPGRSITVRGGAGTESDFEVGGTAAGDGAVAAIRGGAGGQTFNLADTGGNGGNAEVFAGARGSGPGPGVPGEVVLGIGATETHRIKRGLQLRFVPLGAAPSVNVQEGDVYYSSATADRTLVVRNDTVWSDVPLEARANTFTALNIFSGRISSPATSATNQLFGPGITIDAASTNCTAVGQNAVASNAGWQANNTAIGRGAQTTHSACTAIGQGAVASGSGATAIGSGVTAASGVALGSGASNSGGGLFSVGGNAGHGGAIFLGAGPNGGTNAAFQLAYSPGTSAANQPPRFLLAGSSSATFAQRSLFEIVTSWADSTDATRKARVTFGAFDTAYREAFRIEASGSAAMFGFFGAAAVVRPSVNAAASDAATTQALVNSIRTALINLGLVS